MELTLTDKTVIVTGAGRGIGRTLAQRFLNEGMRVVAVDLDFPAPLEGALCLTCDVTKQADGEQVVAQALEHFGNVDVLVNNAGINVEGNVEEVPLERARACFDVNVIGIIQMCQAVIPVMKRAGSGRIINAASFAAIVPAIGAGIYAATKAAVVQLTRTLAGELGPWGITANSYAPGMVPTEMNGFATMPAERQAELLDTLSLRRWGSAEEIADLLCFLASDQSAYITGAMLEITGGKLATQIPSRAYQR